MKLQFLPADASDIPVIFAQAKDLIDAYEDTGAIDYDKVLAWVERKITANISEYCRVTADGAACAYYRLCADGELDDLYVLPQYRNRGIGTQVLQKCIAESEKTLYLYVFSRNIRAISLYRRFGFQVIESVSETRFVMRRNG